MDEAPEFASNVIEALRQPLESGRIVVSRAAQTAAYPARFQLVLAANPCPCGLDGAAGDGEDMEAWKSTDAHALFKKGMKLAEKCRRSHSAKKSEKAVQWLFGIGFVKGSASI